MPNYVTVGANGQLSLPYNAAYGQAQYDAVKTANDQLLGFQTDFNTQQQQYGTQKRNLASEYGNQQRTSRNVAGSRGTVFSSAYGTAVSNDASKNAAAGAELEGQNTNFLQNYELQKGSVQNNLNQTLGLAMNQYAQELAKQAGTLGYGKSSPAKQAAQAKKANPQMTKAANLKSAQKRVSGPQNSALLKSFEKEFGLKADGKLGAKSLAALKKRAKDPKNARANYLLATLQNRPKDAKKYSHVLKPKPKPRSR
jgi:hypothetical protein